MRNQNYNNKDPQLLNKSFLNMTFPNKSVNRSTSNIEDDKLSKFFKKVKGDESHSEEVNMRV